MKKIPETPGINKLRGTIHRVWAPSPQADHPDLPQLQGQEIPATIAAVPTTPPMVDPDTEPRSPSSYVHPTSQPHGLDRRLENRVGGGGIFSGIHSQRRLVPRGEPPPHKHPGMSSRDTISPLTETSTGIRSPGKDGQHCSIVPYQQTRVQQKQDLVSLSARASNTVRSEQLDNPIEAPTRPPQHMGRLPLSKSPSESGVVSISAELPAAENSPQSGDRPLCSPGKRQAAGLQMSIPVPLSHSGRCSSHELEQVEEDLPLPPSRSDSSLPPKTARLQRLRAGHRPSASFRSLVARVPSRLHPTRRRPRHRAMGARRMAESQRENVLSLSRFQFLKNLYSRKYEAPVALALSNAHCGSTRDQYEHCWKDFQRWLTSNPSKPISKGSVLLYLTHLAQTRGLSPKTVLVYRNAPNSAIPVPLSHSGRCSSHELEQVEEDLPLPPSRSDSSLAPKTARLQRLRAGHRPSASFRSLVARVPSRLHPTRRRPRHRAMGARRMAESQRENVLSLSRFQFLKNLYSRKYEALVALALSNAHRGSTRDQYEHCWKDFQRWLTSNPSKPISKGSVLLYLTHLAQTRGLSPKTVLVYRNALKLPLLHGFNINTSDREFSLLARSQFLQNPPPKKLIPAWNPNKVLSMLEQPEFLNHRATPHRLLMKTLFLVALATGNRVSEIAAFTRVGSKILPGSRKAIIAVRPGFLYKNQTMDRSPPNIVIKALLDQNLTPNRLCPVDSLRCWLAPLRPMGSRRHLRQPQVSQKDE